MSRERPDFRLAHASGLGAARGQTLAPWAFSPEPAPGQSPGPASRLKQRRGYADQVRARRFNIVCCASETSEACKNVFPEQPCHDTAPIIINIIRCSYRYDCVFRKGRPAARGSGRGRRRSPVHSCWPDRGGAAYRRMLRWGWPRRCPTTHRSRVRSGLRRGAALGYGGTVIGRLPAPGD